MIRQTEIAIDERLFWSIVRRSLLNIVSAIDKYYQTDALREREKEPPATRSA